MMLLTWDKPRRKLEPEGDKSVPPSSPACYLNTSVLPLIKICTLIPTLGYRPIRHGVKLLAFPNPLKHIIPDPEHLRNLQILIFSVGMYVIPRSTKALTTRI